VIKLFILLLLSVNVSYADDDCVFFKFCGGSSSHPKKSLPSTAAASNLNPGNLSNVKGVGFETLYQKGNPLGFSFVSGNGKVGALISPTLENSFFGNRSIEIDDLTYLRNLNKKQYDNKKLNLSAGIKIVSKKYAELDLGLSVKRNPDIKNFNPGAGINGRLAIFHFGAYFYRDDVKLQLGNYLIPNSMMTYSSFYKNTTYQERFSVDTYTVGTNIQNLSLDAGVIKTRYHFYSENTRVYLYSTSYGFKKWLFNVAWRKEYSPNQAYIKGNMISIRKKSENYMGFQYTINRFFVVGLQYNNFLLHETSGTLTIYF
jgi:hypothetical protein